MSKISIRYIVNDVEECIPFYARLGFEVAMRPAPSFAALRRGDARLLLNEPGAGGAGQPVPGRGEPRPGGWNRIQLEVVDLEATLRDLESAGVRLPYETVVGRGGKQALLEDPSGNLIELFEAEAP